MSTEVQSSRTITLEQNKQLSKCILWKIEREYFEKKGIEAWLYDVPFYVTSNPFIAKAYAKITFHFMRDWIKKHPDAINHPFYLLELGTGPGRFSFYMVKALEELRNDYNMPDLKFVYVMTDFAKANLEYHEKHHALVPYLENGLIDLAIYDMDKDIPPKLIRSNVELNEKTLVNPLMFFANYVFDTIPNDAFAVHNGKLYELLVNISTDESNLDHHKPIELSKLTIDYIPKEINANSYYNDPSVNQTLELYQKELHETSVLVPINSIRALKYLQKLSNGKALLISSDKAYSDIASLDHLGMPSLTFHGGCFSMMVNCHAIGQTIVNDGGDFISQNSRRGLKTCVYTMGFKLDDTLPETRAAVNDYVIKFTPSDYFNLYRHVNETQQNCELDTFASHLELSGWDPHAYMKINNRIMSLITEADPDTIHFFAVNMHRLAGNYYFMPSADCILFEVAVFFHALKRYPEAYEYYQRAEQFVGDTFGLQYNVALCLHHMEKNQEAYQRFQKALSIDPNSQEAKEWMQYLEKSIMDQKYMPKDINR